jgi:hypothetical protein
LPDEQTLLYFVSRYFTNSRETEMRKHQTNAKSNAVQLPKPAVGMPLLADKHEWAPAAKLRKRCGDVSAVTWWRWRNDPALNFPTGKMIRGRWYFPVGPVLEWWARLPQQRAIALGSAAGTATPSQ